MLHVMCHMSPVTCESPAFYHQQTYDCCKAVRVVGKHVHTRLPKYSQIVSWLVTHSGKCCVYTKRTLSQNFRIYEKKLARRLAYLVYKGKS